MKIGIRWSTGLSPHPSVPEEVRPSVVSIDEDGFVGSWTLTWLEGRPICTRDDDTVITLAADGVVTVTYPGTKCEDDDAWLRE